MSMTQNKRKAKGKAKAAGAAPSWKTPRQCDFCKATFTPKRPQDADQKFCEKKHKDLYHKYGALPYRKLLDDLRKDIPREVEREVQRQLAEPVAQMRRDLAELLRVAYERPKGAATA